MQLKIKQKMFSIGDKFAVTNENEEAVFYVKSKFLSLTSKRTVFDLQGNVLFTLRKKLFRFLPTFVVYDGGNNVVATIKRKFSLLWKFVILSGEAKYDVEGDITSWNYQLLKNDAPIGNLTKKIFQLTDTYLLDVYEESEAAFFVAIALVVDLMFQRRKRRR